MNQSLQINKLDLQNNTCSKCPLSELRTCVLNGVGNVQSKIVFVMDSPSVEDDALGTTFTGSVGHKLEAILSIFRIHRNQVFITYATRCRANLKTAEGVRPAHFDEIQICNEYLVKEIESIKPNVIVPMGAEAITAILGIKKPKVEGMRGLELWSDKFQCKVTPTLAIGAILRNPNKEETVIQDLRRAIESSKYPELTKRTEGNYITLETIEQFDAFYDRIMEQKEVAWDIETSGFNWQKDQLICVSFSWKKGTAVVLPITKWVGIEKEKIEIKDKKVRRKGIVEVRQVEVITKYTEDSYQHWWGDRQEYVMSKLRSIMESNIEFILQNGKFDYKFFLQKGWNLKPAVHDPMLMHYLLHETAKGQHGLKDMALQYTDMGAYDQELESWFATNGMKTDDSRNYARVPTELLFKYAAADADVTLQLKDIFLPLLEQEDMLDLYYKLILPLSYNLTVMEFEGFKINKNLLLQTKKELQDEIVSIENEIQKEILKVTTEQFDLASPKQLSKLLFEVLKLPVIKQTKTGYSTDESVLNALKEKHTIPSQLVKHRGLSKLLNTYIESVEEKLDDDNKLHASWNIPGTESGRLSSSNPNLQNIPKDDKRIKNMYTVEAGNVLVEADEAQGEFRLWGAYSLDPQLIKDLTDGLDIHRFIAALANKIDVSQVTPEQRQTAKSIVFGLMFGEGIDDLSKKHNVTTEYAQTIKDTFFSRYPIAKKWRYDNVKRGKRDGFVRSFFGRVRHLPGINSTDNSVSFPDQQAAVNSPIQGCLSDYTANAANRIILKFKELGYHGKLRNLVHDAIYMEIPKIELEESVKIMKEEMERKILGIQVPMIAEFKIAETWGSLKEVKSINPIVYKEEKIKVVNNV
jgi:DNA polymerase-1